MFDCRFDDAREFLDGMQALLWECLHEIRSETDPMQALDATVEQFDPATHEHVLSLHRTAVTNMILNADRAQLDEQIEEQYKECMAELDSFEGKSKAIVIAGDENHEKVATKHRNVNLSYVVVGQTSTWQRGFVFPTEYDAMHQLFIGPRHRDYCLIDIEKKGLRSWIRDVSEKYRAARELGIDRILIGGDRTYFNAELFALAALGKIDPDAGTGYWSGVIVPRKFPRGKDDKKWEYLLDAQKKQVFIDYIGLNPVLNPALKEECEATFTKAKNGHFEIPYICVAMVDEYSSKKKRTLEEVRDRARIV